MSAAYYNEIDPKAAAWLRQLILKRMIAPGDVDERSITEVSPDDIKGYTQCHFFAGIGVWSYALRRAGWDDSRPVWTGSCPCQPFSVAGQKGGIDDERHLWPAWFDLIRERRPRVIFGEQVSSKDALTWLDHVQADMENARYALGALDLCAAGVGAPHIRQRLFFVAERVGDALGARLEGYSGDVDDRDEPGRLNAQPGRPVAETGGDERLADTEGRGFGEQRPAMEPRDIRHPDGSGDTSSGMGNAGRESSERGTRAIPAAQAECPGEGRSDGRHDNGYPDAGEAGGLADAENERRHQRAGHGDSEPARQRGNEPADSGAHNRPGPTNGFWRGADWLGCRDGKFRPVEPGTFPLADGAPARVGRLRGYGNAINAEVARLFIESYLEC